MEHKVDSAQPGRLRQNGNSGQTRVMHNRASLAVVAMTVILVCTTSAWAQPVQTAPAAPIAGQRGGRGVVPVQIGPPAPVPAEVAMLRPTGAELTQINDAVRRFIETDKSPTAPLLKKYESVLMVQPPRLNTAAT